MRIGENTNDVAELLAPNLALEPAYVQYATCITACRELELFESNIYDFKYVGISSVVKPVGTENGQANH